MKITFEKQDIFYFIIFLFSFIAMAQEGYVKYILLLILALIFFVVKEKILISQFLIGIHSLLYIICGVAIAIVTHNFSFECIKRSSIYFSSLIVAISLYTFLKQKKEKKIIVIQFLALCTSYMIMYGENFNLKQLYFESDKFAYIFGVYVLFFLLQKKYVLMCISALFMIWEHKRIANGATLIMFLFLIFVIKVKKEKIQKLINFFARGAFLILPFVWIFLCKSGLLTLIFSKLKIYSMGRLDGRGVWILANSFYDFSPFYLGRGIGFVTTWLKSINYGGFVQNLHNDLMVAYIELGFWGFLIWLLSFQYILYYVKKKKGVKISNIIAVLLGHMFISMLTDNIYIYVTFLIPFYIMLLEIIFGNENFSNINIEENININSNIES